MSLSDTDLYTILLSQNNDKQTVKIKEVSDSLAQKLGYFRSEMEGEHLAGFLSAKCADAITDYLEYVPEGPDIDQIINHMQEFKMKTRQGAEMAFSPRIIRDAPLDQHQWFRLMLQDERRQIEESAFSRLLKENIDGVQSLDPATGVADRQTLEQYLRQVSGYVQAGHFPACFALIRLDRYQKSIERYGKTACEALMRHIATHCKGKFRDEDLVGRYSDQAIGLVLINTDRHTGRIVLNRLRWFIASHRLAFAGKPNFSVTVSIVFDEMQEEGDVALRCETVLDALPDDERSQLVEAR